MIMATGSFSGRGGHVLRGDFIFQQNGTNIEFITSDDFFFDGSPEPGWALTRGNIFTQASADAGKIGLIPKEVIAADDIVSGRHTLIVPLQLKITDHDAVFLWCYEFPFLLGVGTLNFTMQDGGDN